MSVNDIVMALCTSALRSWLAEHAALPDQPLVAAVPVAVRTAAPESGGQPDLRHDHPDAHELDRPLGACGPWADHARGQTAVRPGAPAPG